MELTIGYLILCLFAIHGVNSIFRHYTQKANKSITKISPSDKDARRKIWLNYSLPIILSIILFTEMFRIIDNYWLYFSSLVVYFLINYSRQKLISENKKLKEFL